jgi:hypothetical protein
VAEASVLLSRPRAPEVSEADQCLATSMLTQANRGWYTGDVTSLKRFAVRRDLIARTELGLGIRLLLSKDRMHHSVGWWRNAEYEYCWHLSVSAWDRDRLGRFAEPEDIPVAEERYWTHAFFPVHFNKLWHEPGGTDPRLTPREKMRHRHFSHLRLFLDPETFQPFIPQGEVYDLTRWIDGLTPEKVDRYG